MKKDPVMMIAATPFFSNRGGHVRIYNEIKYLNKNNIETILYTYNVGNDIKGFNIKKIKKINWYKKITPGASFGKIYLDFLLLILSIKEFKKIKPSIIHAHLYEGLLIAWLTKIITLSKVKIIFDCQGSLAQEMYEYTLKKSNILKPFYPIFVLLEKILLYMPNEIICSSINSFNFLKNKYKINSKKISILNDGVDYGLFRKVTEKEKQKLRKELSLSKDNIVFIYTGSLSIAKGVKELLDSIPEIIKEKPNYTFIFLGYGDLEKEYRKKLSNIVSSKNIIFTGEVSYFDLPRFLGAADYAIDPKQNSSESSGKMFNYMAMNLPIICFKNEFNFSFLKDEGMYINNFLNLINIDSRQKTNNYKIHNDLDLNYIIKKLILIYEK